MKRALLHAALVLAVLAGIVAPVPAGGSIAEAVPNGQAGPDGKIAFVRDGQIWTMNADGSGATQLTSQGNNVDPHWSPDGSQIVFASNRDGDKNPLQNELTLWHLYVMSADGSNQRLVTPRDQNVYSPVFTPDGGFIVFIRDYGYAGSMPRQPQGAPPGQQPPQQPGRPPVQPTPTPSAPPFSYTNAISILNLADNSINNIAATEQPKDAPFSYLRLSPDGQTILYQVALPPGFPRGIELINVDGSNRRTIYYSEDDNQVVMYHPYFFPDGQRILYSAVWFKPPPQTQATPAANQPPPQPTIVRTSVEWVNADGSSRQIIAELPTELQAAVPGPDGQRMLVSFSKQTGQRPEDRTDEIYLYSTDGAQLGKLTDGYMPDWYWPR